MAGAGLARSGVREVISQVSAVKLSCEEPGCDAALYERDAQAVSQLAQANGWRSVGWVAQVEGQPLPKMTLCPVHKEIADKAGE